METLRLLRPTEVAQILSLGRSKVYSMIASGELPSIKCGKSVRVPMEALREWVNVHTQGNDFLTSRLDGENVRQHGRQ